MQQTLRTRYRVTKMMRDYLGDAGLLGNRDAVPDQEHARRGARLHRALARDPGIFTRCRSRRSSSSSC
jgi:hypothetical protein